MYYRGVGATPAMSRVKAPGSFSHIAHYQWGRFAS